MAERKPLISGNWKMHLNHLEAIQLIQKLSYALDRADYAEADVSIHPPFTNLRSAQTVLDADGIPIALGAQHCHWDDKGAFTGEVSPTMLARLAVSYVIAGHSERRQLFGETDENVNRRLKAILGAGMTPIMCCGETLEEREADRTEARLNAQVQAGLAGLKRDQVAAMVIAYEPVWAIGTGRTATPADAQSGCSVIRERVRADFGPAAADGVRIQYGGSVKPVNVAELMAQPDIDGALVGGASLEADSFSRIVRFRMQ
ncbi:triose-phosphate isomerase [Candidatus Poriferisocius sp.]|uniref:triose-phosphate isomerase n=1 Tax=Candidatus Poriferisocius sp. TaxID=3101276 RepID=UPI003B5ACB09